MTYGPSHPVAEAHQGHWTGLTFVFFSCLHCICLFRAGFGLLAPCLLACGEGKGAGTGAFLMLGPAHGCPFCFQGRQAGAQIDPWEDADFTLYKVTDRFGFLQ